MFLLGNVGIDYAEQGSPGRSHRRDARLTLTCASTVACVWSGAWDAELAARARTRHRAAVGARPGQPSLVLYCPDTRAAQALQRSLRVFQRGASH